MSRANKNERNRRIGALLGLCVGIATMYALGFRGLVPAFMFGAGCCLAGGMIGERIGPPRGEISLPPAAGNDEAQ